MPIEFKRVNDATHTITANVWKIWAISINSDKCFCKNKRKMQINAAYLETNLYSPFYWNPQRCKFDSKECKWRGIFHHLYRSFKHSIHTFCKDYFGKQWFFVNIKLLKISLKHLDNNNRLELVCIWDNSCAIKFFLLWDKVYSYQIFT